MAKFILNENQYRLLKRTIMLESYPDKVLDIKDFLDKNYVRGEFLRNDDGKKKTIGVFVQLSDKGVPTKDSVYFDDVFYRLQKERSSILPREDRDGFLKDVIRAWYDRKINDRGNIVN